MPLAMTATAQASVAAELTEFEYFMALNAGAGPSDAKLRRNTGQDGEVVEQSPVSLKVDVGTLAGWATGNPVRMAAAVESDAVVAPTGGAPPDLRRIDLVQYTDALGINIVTGVEDAAPSAPAVSANSIGLAHLYCRNGMTSIKDADDSTNGYIVDVRTYL